MKNAWIPCALLFATVILAREQFGERPDRLPQPDRTVAIAASQVRLGGEFGALRLAGAWSLSAPDARFGGLSSLAWAGGRLVALTDSGATVDFGAVNGAPDRATLRDLPGGPGRPLFKAHRDSEALAAGPDGRWWVAFENRHGLWAYDAALTRTLYAARLPQGRWGANRGIEAMVWAGDRLLLFPERKLELIEIRRGDIRSRPLRRDAGWPTDAQRMPDGRILVTTRSFTALGIVNRLALLERAASGYRLRNVARLPLGPFDNVEGLAVQPLANKRLRLWLVTDNDFSRWRRTLLVAIDAPPPSFED